MKILITSDWYKPVVNGVVTSIINLAEGLKADGNEVKILTLSNSVHAHKDGDVYYIGSLPAGLVYPNARVVIFANHSYLKELSDWKPDVIHSQCEFSTFILARKISAETGAPIVHTYHTVYEGYTHYFCPNRAVGKKIAAMFSRHIANETSAFIVPSSKISDMLSGYHIHTPMYVIPSGIRLDSYLKDGTEARRKIRESFSIAPEETLLISIGRLAREKNLDEVLQFLAVPGAPELKLLIVGDGPYREALEEQVQALGLTGRVLFAGMVPPDEVADYYKAGDIFVSASTSETQGLTYMEAMASGLPMLCREDPCLQGVIVSGENGFTYHNAENFDESLRELVQNAGLRQNFGVAARESVLNRYSVSTFVCACKQIYQKYAS